MIGKKIKGKEGDRITRVIGEEKEEKGPSKQGASRIEEREGIQSFQRSDRWG